MGLKIAPFVRNARRILNNPFADLELVIELFDAVAESAPVSLWYQRLRARIPPADARALEALTREPLDLERLRALPAPSFGRHLASFLDDNHLNPNYYLDLYPPVRPVFERNWLAWRFAKTHDMHHTLLGVGVSVADEVGLQVFNCVNFSEPTSAASIALLPYIMMRYPEGLRSFANARAGLRGGLRVANLLTFPFELHYATDITTLRRWCGVPEGGLYG